MNLETLQQDFTQAIFANEFDAITAAVKSHGQLDAKQRVGIYRNSVHGILLQYFSSLYTVCEMLVGKEFFSHLSDTYVDTYPPDSPYLPEYGGKFSSVIAQHEALQDMSWIADVASIEWARHLAWNAVLL